jgi:ribonuclease HI
VTITAAADGSALGNPGPAGWAWYIDDDRWAAGGWKHGTNNMGELKAVLELFRATEHSGEDLLVLCDSQYVINSVTKWMPGWKKKGWRKGDGKPVMNLDLLQELDEAIAGRKYRFEWVKGHVGHVLNEAADARARGAAEAYQRGLEVPTGPGFGPVSASPVRVTVPVHAASGPASLFEIDEPELHEVTLQLTTEEHSRLLQRARREGLSPDELLRGFI